jgi:hypothetical protein
VIYSCAALAPESKRKVHALTANRFFDLSALQLPADELEALHKVLSLLRSVREMAVTREQSKTK